MNKTPLFAVGVVLSMTLAVGGAVILSGTPESSLRCERGRELQ